MAKIIDNLTDTINNNQNLNSLGQNSPNNSQNQVNSSENQEPGLMNILVSALTPLIPVVLAKMTGQRLPSANNAPDNQNVNQQFALGLQTILSNQQVIFQELASLKNNAQSLANNFQSLRLTHEREKKQIDFNTNNNLDNYEN
jgi:hypothetical protein